MILNQDRGNKRGIIIYMKANKTLYERFDVKDPYRNYLIKYFSSMKKIFECINVSKNVFQCFRKICYDYDGACLHLFFIRSNEHCMLAAILFSLLIVVKSIIINRGNTAGKQDKNQRKPQKHRQKHPETPEETVGNSWEIGET